MGHKCQQNKVTLRIDPALRDKGEPAPISHSQSTPTQPPLPPQPEPDSPLLYTRSYEQIRFSSIVTTIILLLTGIVVMSMISQKHKTDRDHFNLLKAKLESEIIRRVGVYRYGLMGTRSAFLASNMVERQEFQKLVLSRELSTEFPAATGIGYVEYVPKNMLETFLKVTRDDGASDYHIRRLNRTMSESDYMLIKYIEPAQTNKQAIGLDIGSEKNRREAAENAMLTGNVTITRSITLVQATTEGAGFLILLPVYNTHSHLQSPDERRKQIKGWVYMTILAQRLFEDVTHWVDNELNFAVFDDSDLNSTSILYDGFRPNEHNEQHHQSHYVNVAQVQIGGRLWYVRMESSDAFQMASYTNAWWAGISGLILTLMISTIMHMQSTAMSRAKQIASEMTEDLQKSLTQLNQAMRETEEARRSAEMANQYKSEFLATMSHEIRTPLNGILGMASVLGQSQLDTTQRNHLNTITSSSESLMIIINDILDFSKIEAGKLVIEHIPCSPRQIAKEVTDLIQFLANQKNLQLFTEIDKKVPQYIMGDPVRIRQIILNLMNNAIKFTDTGSVKLKIKLNKIVDQRVHLDCSVTDTGSGIDDQTKARLFEKFSQADSSTTRKHGGTGLGLAICKSLVKIMNGQIGIESQLGAGATFWFTLVCELAEDQNPLQLHDQLNANQKALPYTLENYNILVVDDNPINRMVAGKMLEILHANVTLSSNAADAFDQTRSTQFHLILMDCQMPEIDGYEATRQLRNVCKRHATPADVTIIALTANAMSQDRQLCLDAGMNDFLAKPITLTTLQKTLEKWIAPRQQNVA